MAEVPSTVSVQAYGTDGIARTTGGETFYLKIEQLCTVSGSTCCTLSAFQDSVPGLPIEVTMQDNGDGTYEHTYLITGGGGTITLSISVLTEGGAYAEYYTNSSLSGSPSYCFAEGPIDNNWGGGVVTPTSQADSVSARWTGYIYPPTTETYQFEILHDDQFAITVGAASF